MRFVRRTRDLDHMIVGAVAACLGTGLLLLGGGFWSVVPFLLSAACLWGYFRERVATLDISSSELTWDFRQFRKTAGSITASQITRILVNDCGSVIEVHTASGAVERVPYASSGASVLKEIKMAYPNVPVNYESGT